VLPSRMVRVSASVNLPLHHKSRSSLLAPAHPGGPRKKDIKQLCCGGVVSGQPWVSQYQKGKPFSILLQQETTGWQWHQLDDMQIICTLLQTDNHASTSTLSFYSQMPFLPPNQQHQSTEGINHTCSKVVI